MGNNINELVEEVVERNLEKQRSLEGILKQDTQQLRDTINERFKLYGVIAAFILGVFGVLGYNLIKETIVSQVSKILVEPEVRKIVKISINKESKKFITESIEPLDKEIIKLKNGVNDIESRFLESENNVDAINSKIETAVTKINSINQNVEKDKKSIQNIGYGISELNKKSENLFAEIKKMKILAANIDELKVTIESLKNGYDQFQNRIDSSIVEIKEIEKSISNLKKDVERVIVENNNISKETEAIKKYYVARTGIIDAYTGLKKLRMQSANEYQEFVEALLEDVEHYYSTYSYKTYRRQIIDSISREPINPNAEQCYQRITIGPTETSRRAGVNEVAERGWKFFVDLLVHCSQNDNNAKVRSQAVLAIEKLTGEKFTKQFPFENVQTWWEETGRHNEEYHNPFDKIEALINDYKKSKNQESLNDLIEIVQKNKGLCDTCEKIGLFYLIENNLIEAKKFFKKSHEECDKQFTSSLLYLNIRCLSR